MTWDSQSSGDSSTLVVTGALGGVGSWVVDHFADEGADVTGLDLERPSGHRSNAEFREVDLRDQGSTWETMFEIDPDAVIHTAAISGPLDDPNTTVFENNVMSTYNALEAAGRIGAQIVWTSSQAVYGMLYAREPSLPEYLPVDERHPRTPEDAYGLSKLCGEEIAKTVARHYGCEVTSIRPSSIFAPGQHRTRPQREGLDLKSEEFSGNLWSYVDVRDVARMIESALDTPTPGYNVYNCVADENYLGRPTLELIESTAGELPEVRDIEGTEAALSNEKAKSRLGWEPIHSWEDGNPDESSQPGWV